MAADAEIPVPTEPAAPMKPTLGGIQDYTDGRKPWEWESRYPAPARREMNVETRALLAMLIVSILGAGFCLGLADQNVSISVGGPELSISFRLLAIFFTGSVGGVTFSIKWLIHSVAKGKWHLDRRYWRLMTPIVGGVYACVVMTLFASGMFAAETAAVPTAGIAPTAALAFLVGYFSDGVSGLLSNIANAVFGTLEKK
ncbi:hypothetical protein ACPVPU_09850 [Sphingomonas sp. CJ99]